MRADLIALTLSLFALQGACADENSCEPGEQRACVQTLDGAYTQRGYQACGGLGVWSACVSVGACTAPDGGVLLSYARCDTNDQCGPAGCAICSHYTGLKNPNGYGLCRTYCQADSDCTPGSATTNVTPRCVLGQCSLFCRAGSACPRDTQCLPWASASLASANPGFAGLCE